jgi:hypothetical protein
MKHLKFIVSAESKHNFYSVHSTHTNDLLGSIYYYPKWKEYVFYPNDDTIWSSGCMQEIIDFIKTIKE